MANWPTIETPSIDFEEETYFPFVRTEFEGNYVQQRPRSTRSRKRFSLKWKAMTQADYDALVAAFVAGELLTWTHPVTSTSYTVIFSEDSLKARYVAEDRWEVSCQIEEQ
jgi:hypothetical protein